MNQLAATKTAASQQQQQQSAPPQPQTTSLLDSELTPSPLLVPLTSATSNAVPVSSSNMNNSMPLAPSTADKDDSDSLFSPMVSAPMPAPPPTQELLPLTDVFVPLESIKPGTVLHCMPSHHCYTHCVGKHKKSYTYMFGGFFLTCEDFGRMFIHSPACAFFFFFFKVEITLTPLFMPGLVHSGSASREDCGHLFPDRLHVSSFLDGFPHYAWTTAYSAHSNFVGSRVYACLGVICHLRFWHND